jgi:DNA-binding CsgD family transcriptional regulator
MLTARLLFACLILAFGHYAQPLSQQKQLLKKWHAQRNKSLKETDLKKLNDAYFQLGFAFQTSALHKDSSNYYFRQSLSIASKMKDIRAIGLANYQIGDYYFNTGNFDSTIYYYLKAQTNFKQVDLFLYADSYYHIGELYFTFEAYKSALNYFRKSLALKLKMSAKASNLPFAYWSLAEAHYALKNQDSALYYYRLSSTVATKTRNIPYYGNEGIAQIKINQQQYDSALIYLKPVQKWYFESNVSKWIADMGLLYMEIYSHKRNHTEFAYWRGITRKHTFSTFLPEQRKRYYKTVSTYFNQENQLDSAYYFLRLENKEWNAIASLKAKSNVDALIEAYNNLKQRNELLSVTTMLNKQRIEKRAADLENKQLAYENQFFLVLVVTSLIVLALLVYITLLIYRQKQKSKQKTMLLEEANSAISQKIVELSEKELRIREMQMKSSNPVVILDKSYTITEFNPSFLQTIPVIFSEEQSFEKVVGHQQFSLFKELIETLKPYESGRFRCIWDKDVFLSIDFNVINLLDDSTVKGFVLEGKNVTDELLLQKTETNNLVTKLDEKEQLIFQVNKEAAVSNLKLDLTRQTFHELSVKMENNLPKEARMKELKDLVQHGLQSDKYWDNFLKHFDIAHQQFFRFLHEKHPDLTINEEKHCAFLKIKLSNKEVASILGVAPDTVKKARQRLKKKLCLTTDDSLKSYIEQF